MPISTPTAVSDVNRYAVFSVAIKRVRAGSEASNRLSAGLLVLRCADERVAPRPRPRRIGVRRLATVQRLVERVSPNCTRLALKALLEASDSAAPADQVLVVMGDYADCLQKNGEFDLAVSVWRRVIECAIPCDGFDMAPAYRRLAFCLRELGAFDEAEHEITLGTTWALRYRDERAILQLQIARAAIAYMRGNLGGAVSRLDIALAGAETLGDPELIARAAHERGNLAYARHHLLDALTFHERARRAIIDWKRSNADAADEAQSRLLNDIGLVLVGLGMADQARRAFQSVALDASERGIRWTATINLMRLAAASLDAESFREHAEGLGKTPLPARLRAVYLEECGDGHMIFGQVNEARVAYLKLVRLAERNDLAEFEKRAFDKLRGAPVTSAERVTNRVDVPSEAEPVVREIRRLGEHRVRTAELPPASP